MHCSAVRVARYAFCILHACMNHGLAYVGRRSKVNRDPARGEELASLIRLWQDGYCFARVHNKCAIKNCALRRCVQVMASGDAQTGFASQFIFANMKVFPVLLPVAQRLLDHLCYFIRSLTIVPLLLSVILSRCTIGDFTRIFIIDCAIWCKLIFCRLYHYRLIFSLSLEISIICLQTNTKTPEKRDFNITNEIKLRFYNCDLMKRLT